MMNLEVVTQLPAPARREGWLFVEVADRLDLNRDNADRTGAGVTHIPWGCDEIFVGPSEWCLPTSGDPVPADPEDQVIVGTGFGDKDAAITDYPEIVVHPAFKIVDGLRCNAISLPHDSRPVASIDNRGRWRFQSQISKMLLAELTSGRASGGISLDSEAVSLPASSGVPAAAVNIESHLAGVLHNNVGVVVLPVGLLAAAIYHGWVNPATKRTFSGHYVIADAGFTGDPDNPTDSTPGSFTIFGMGVPAWTATNQKVLDVASGSSHVDISSNVIQQITEAYAQVAFDPCSVGATVVSLDGGTDLVEE